MIYSCFMLLRNGAAQSVAYSSIAGRHVRGVFLEGGGQFAEVDHPVFVHVQFLVQFAQLPLFVLRQRVVLTVHETAVPHQILVRLFSSDQHRLARTRRRRLRRSKFRRRMVQIDVQRTENNVMVPSPSILPAAAACHSKLFARIRKLNKGGWYGPNSLGAPRGIFQAMFWSATATLLVVWVWSRGWLNLLLVAPL